MIPMWQNINFPKKRLFLMFLIIRINGIVKCPRILFLFNWTLTAF